MSNIDFVSGDICEQILTRLPVKSLLRFKCVSKPWLSLISSPRFVKKHLNISSNSPGVMSYTDNGVKLCSANSLILDPEVIDVDYPDINSNQSVAIIGSCNGLVCFNIGRIGDDYCIWNPVTRVLKKIAPVNVKKMDEWDSMMHKFGYNAADDDYKVVRVFIKEDMDTDSGTLEVDVYSLKANSWKKRVFTKDGICPYSEVNFIAGKIYISAGTQTRNDAPELNKDAYIFNVKHIVSLDSGDEMHGIIEIPDFGQGVKILFLEELGGCFCVVCKKETHADFWVMKEYGVKDSWCKILTVSFSNDIEEYAYPAPMFMLPSGEILVGSEDRLEVYDLENDNMRVLDTSVFGEFPPLNVFVESLVSPIQYD